jgi:hypothetical protein
MLQFRPPHMINSRLATGVLFAVLGMAGGAYPQGSTYRLTGLAADDTGGAVFSFKAESGPSHIRYRKTDALGEYGSQFRISRRGPDAQANDVAVDAAGNATFCWTDDRIKVRRVLASGVGESILRAQSVSAREGFEPDVAVNAAGDSVCVWVERYEDFPGRRQVQAYILPAGSAVGMRRGISSTVAGADAEMARVAVAQNGTATITWFDQNQRVLVRTLDASGNLGSIQALEEDIPLRNVEYASDVSVAVDPAGVATVVWSSMDDGGWVRVRGRRIVDSSSPASPLVTLSPYGWHGRHPALDVDASGTSHVIFASDRNTSSTTDPGPVMVRRWAADGTLGPVRVVSAPSATAGELRRRPGLAVKADGEATAIWHQTGSEIHARRILPDGSLGPELDLEGTGVDLAVDVNVSGHATLAWVTSLGALKTRHLDATGTLGPIRNIAYLQ